jgi:dienelactone hydrolase
LYQWSWASGQTASAAIIKASNFGEKALAPVGRGGIGPFGTYDMAGNAKEWVANPTGDRRYIVGGAWNEPIYTFNYPDAQQPLSREPSYGFRLVKALDALGARTDSNPVPWSGRNYAVEKPVTAKVFDVFKRLYAYDRTPLNARIEAIDDSAERWRKEKISFAAAYGDERVTAYLFTPRNFAPPFQTVVFFPDSSALLRRSSEQLTLMRIVGPIVRSGRALLYPVYKSTYERADAIRTMGSFPTALYRDHVISWARDVSRSIDYAETRPDLQAGRVALYGVSWGAKLAPLIAAVEDRIKVGIMVAGGLAPSKAMPEVDPLNFAPHVHQPMLMLNGQYDFIFPVVTNQSPLFELLGSPAADKRHVLFDAGPMPPNDALTREALDWLDRHFGPVAAQAR